MKTHPSDKRGNDFSDIHAATMPVHVPIRVMQTLCDQSKTNT